jgi:hypothetical protein
MHVLPVEHCELPLVALATAVEVEAASGLRVSDMAAENGGLVLITPVIEDALSVRLKYF